MANRFQQATPDGPANTKTDIWITPKWIIDKIGISELDPCGWLPNGQPIVRTANNYFTEQDNGLIQDWSMYGTAFVNFPYSGIYEWMKKCRDEAAKGCEIITLCFARTETKAWQHHVKNATGINLMNKRVKFLNQHGIEKGNGNCPSVLIAWGENAFNRIKNVDGIILRVVR